MIRYDISEAELERRVDAKKDTWRTRAAKRTKTFRDHGAYDASETPMWSEIKEVFIDLQECKCAFCERKLESKKEYDIEHFRPKGSVKPWTVPAELKAAGVQVMQTKAKEPGYHLLPYHLLNYSVACARCNSELKRDHFPIRGTRRSAGENPAVLQAAEEAWLIFPLGRYDDDPEKLLTFHGLSPQAVARAGSFAHQRALVTIAFFNLDNRNKRRELFRGRADVIQKLGLAFRTRDAAGVSADLRIRCQRIIDHQQSAAAPHSLCGRAYAQLWARDPAAAERVWEEAVDFLDTISPARQRKAASGRRQSPL